MDQQNLSQPNEEELVAGIREWLGEDGIRFFRDLKSTHGRIDACWNEGGIPHIVHFREGMQVRNQLRELTNFSWTSHEYDERWVSIIERAIE